MGCPGVRVGCPGGVVGTTVGTVVGVGVFTGVWICPGVGVCSGVPVLMMSTGVSSGVSSGVSCGSSVLFCSVISVKATSIGLSVSIGSTWQLHLQAIVRIAMTMRTIIGIIKSLRFFFFFLTSFLTYFNILF